VKTYAWSVTDVLVVARARNVDEARQAVREKMRVLGIDVPEGVEEEEPDVLGDGDVVWCWS